MPVSSASASDAEHRLVNLALGQPQQGQSRLGRPAQLCCLAVAGLGLRVAEQPVYLGELVVSVAGDELAVVSAEVVADESHLLQRFLPGTAQTHQVCPIDPAIAEVGAAQPG